MSPWEAASRSSIQEQRISEYTPFIKNFRIQNNRLGIAHNRRLATITHNIHHIHNTFKVGYLTTLSVTRLHCVDDRINKIWKQLVQLELTEETKYLEKPSSGDTKHLIK
jgi:hypothetical protein